MSVQSRKLASRVTSALRNESVLTVTNVNAEYVRLYDGKGYQFGALSANPEGFLLYGKDFAKSYGALEFGAMVADIRTLDKYPAPKVRIPKATPKVRHTTMTGVSMGRFIPGNLAAIGE